MAGTPTPKEIPAEYSKSNSRVVINAGTKLQKQSALCQQERNCKFFLKKGSIAIPLIVFFFKYKKSNLTGEQK